MTNLKVATTPQLVELAKCADDRDLNRRMPNEPLDPHGLHIIKVEMIHEHANGVPVEPHYRCLVVAKCTGDDEPMTFYLDTSIDLVEDLVDADKAKPIVAAVKGRWAR